MNVYKNPTCFSRWSVRVKEPRGERDIDEQELKVGDTVEIITGAGAGVKAIVTKIENNRATCINLFKGTYEKLLTDLKRAG